MTIPSINWTAAKWIAIGLSVVVAFGLGWNIGSNLKQAQWDAAVAKALEQEVKLSLIHI